MYKPEKKHFQVKMCGVCTAVATFTITKERFKTEQFWYICMLQDRRDKLHEHIIAF